MDTIKIRESVPDKMRRFLTENINYNKATKGDLEVLNNQFYRNMLNSFKKGTAKMKTCEGKLTLYRIADKMGCYWSLHSPEIPFTDFKFRMEYAIKQEFQNNATKLYIITIPKGSSIDVIEGIVGPQVGLLFDGKHQVWFDLRKIPMEWIKEMSWGVKMNIDLHKHEEMVEKLEKLIRIISELENVNPRDSFYVIQRREAKEWLGFLQNHFHVDSVNSLEKEIGTRYFERYSEFGEPIDLEMKRLDIYDELIEEMVESIGEMTRKD